MNDQLHHVALGTLRWLSQSELRKPRTKFAVTAYRKRLGVNDLFSVVIEVPSVRSNGELTVEDVSVTALVPEMLNRLPNVGELMVVTDGYTPIAEFMCKQIQ